MRDHREVHDAVAIAVELACDQRTELEAAPEESVYEDWLSRAIVGFVALSVALVRQA